MLEGWELPTLEPGSVDLSTSYAFSTQVTALYQPYHTPITFLAMVLVSHLLPTWGRKHCGNLRCGGVGGRWQDRGGSPPLGTHSLSPDYSPLRSPSILEAAGERPEATTPPSTSTLRG